MRVRPHQRLFLISICSIAAISFGCGPGHELDTAPVQGQVTFDGAPVPQGFVVFIPPRGRRATGTLDEAGRYTLSTYRNGDGAVVGTHKVGVVAYTNMDAFYQAQYSDSGNYEMPKSLIPEAYGDPFSSGLTFEVEAGKTNNANFEL